MVKCETSNVKRQIKTKINFVGEGSVKTES